MDSNGRTAAAAGRIKDYGAMKRAVKIFNSDTYSALHVRQAFYDSSYAFHPAQLEGHLGSVDGRYRPYGVAGVRYAFRSTSMGCARVVSRCAQRRQRDGAVDSGGEGHAQGVRRHLQIQDSARSCGTVNLYHIFPRPDGRGRDGIEYYDPERGTGVVYVFQPKKDESEGVVRFKRAEPRTHLPDRFRGRVQSILPQSRRGTDGRRPSREARRRGRIGADLLRGGPVVGRCQMVARTDV